VELTDAVRRRRMVRSFSTRPVDPDALARVLDLGRRAPSAGFAQGLDLLVLDTPAAVATYWDCTFVDAAARARFRWQGLFRAPVLVLPLSSAPAYVGRYAEADKAATGLGADTAAWPVPYWDVDAGMAAMLLLLGAVDEGLGALFFGIFRGADALVEAFGIPSSHRPIGTIALGHPDAGAAEAGRSAGRARRPFSEVVHRNGW